jgi:hypothetical protein
VPIVRLTALEIFQSKLINFHPIELIKNFNLMNWLTTIQRTNLRLLTKDSIIKFESFIDVDGGEDGDCDIDHLKGP